MPVFIGAVLPQESLLRIERSGGNAAQKVAKDGVRLTKSGRSDTVGTS
jgi:hypothetical protein